MRIKQGTNAPMQITFDIDISQMTAFSVLIHDSSGNVIRKWRENEMQIVGTNEISIPLAEAETIDFPDGRAFLTAKAMDSDDDIIFFNTVDCYIEATADKTILGGAE